MQKSLLPDDLCKKKIHVTVNGPTRWSFANSKMLNASVIVKSCVDDDRHNHYQKG